MNKQEWLKKELDWFKTAIESFKKELESYGDPSMLHIDWKTLDELYEQAKQIEDEQLLKKYGECYDEGLYDGMNK